MTDLWERDMPNSADTITAHDVMDILRDIKAKGFAERALVVEDKSAGFQAQQMWSDTDEAIPETETDAVVPSELDHLAELVAQQEGAMPPVVTEPDAEEEASSDPEITENSINLPPETAEEAFLRGFEEGKSAGHAEGYETGLSAGQNQLVDQALSEAKESELSVLRETRALFDTLVHEIARFKEEFADDLTAQLSETVQTLVSERVGATIDELPAAFIQRIEAAADHITGSIAEARIRLNPEDHALVMAELPEDHAIARAQITSDETLSRGDLDIKAGAIRMRDQLKAT